MKNLMHILLFALVIISCSIKEEIKPEYTILYPKGINSGEKKMIDEVVNKPDRNYKDYIQLTIIYGKYEKSPEEITYWLNKAWEDDVEKTRAVLEYLLEEAKEWDLVKKYPKEIKEVILKET